MPPMCRGCTEASTASAVSLWRRSLRAGRVGRVGAGAAGRGHAAWARGSAQCGEASQHSIPLPDACPASTTEGACGRQRCKALWRTPPALSLRPVPWSGVGVVGAVGAVGRCWPSQPRAGTRASASAAATAPCCPRTGAASLRRPMQRGTVRPLHRSPPRAPPRPPRRWFPSRGSSWHTPALALVHSPPRADHQRCAPPDCAVWAGVRCAHWHRGARRQGCGGARSTILCRPPVRLPSPPAASPPGRPQPCAELPACAGAVPPAHCSTARMRGTTPSIYVGATSVVWGGGHRAWGPRTGPCTARCVPVVPESHPAVGGAAPCRLPVGVAGPSPPPR